VTAAVYAILKSHPTSSRPEEVSAQLADLVSDQSNLAHIRHMGFGVKGTFQTLGESGWVIPAMWHRTDLGVAS
jgi:hypothetical protein